MPRLRPLLSLFSLGLASLTTPTVVALSEYDALVTVKGFADALLAPNNVQVANSINSTLFAEDVTGTVDLSTNFDGRELSTEYLFGLFVNNAKDATDPSPFGSPQSYNVTHIVAEHTYIASSIIFQFYYPALDQSYPIQIDSFILINEQRQIQQYDAIFRRWAWATDVIVPLLVPHMADRINTNSTNSTLILQQYLAQKVCHTSETYCNGTNQQYDSYDACMDFVLARPIGEWYRMGEDNLVCRHLHVPMLPLRPSVHCPHIGPTGGDMCLPRDYNDVVLASHFPYGWLAPRVVTPENAKDVADLQATSNDTLDPLLEIAMSRADTHSWDPTLYATALLCYFLAYYICANVLWFIYFRKSTIFPTLTLELQKNVVIYTMNIIFTTIALGLQLTASPAFAGKYRLWEVQALRTGGVVVSSLYIFELVYRLQMRLPLIIHHFLTIFAISWTVTVFEYTSSMTYLVSAIIWLFQTTTEQLSFLGLLGYRLDWSPVFVTRLLKIASIQTFIFKLASAIGLLVYWGTHQNYNYQVIDRAWTALLFIIAIGLLLTQMWGSYVTWAIGRRIEKSGGLPKHDYFVNKSSLAIYQTVRSRQSTSSASEQQKHQRTYSGSFTNTAAENEEREGDDSSSDEYGSSNGILPKSFFTINSPQPAPPVPSVPDAYENQRSPPQSQLNGGNGTGRSMTSGQVPVSTSPSPRNSMNRRPSKLRKRSGSRPGSMSDAIAIGYGSLIRPMVSVDPQSSNGGQTSEHGTGFREDGRGDNMDRILEPLDTLLDRPVFGNVEEDGNGDRHEDRIGFGKAL